MVASMTGYGRGEAALAGITALVELRSVNSRFLEVSARLPRSLALKENDIKELVRKRISRGKINLVVAIEDAAGDPALKVNITAARSYHSLLKQLKTAVGLRERITLEHLLHFSDVIEQEEQEGADQREWEAVQRALETALDALTVMRANEGGELGRDLRARIVALESTIGQIEELSREQVPAERARLRERITQLLEGEPADEGRLEMELALLADRLDVTEECVRFRSHDKFFLKALEAEEPAGRKLNFLIQEMNREINTIGSKSSSTAIAHLVVGVKEELERIREQLQNIE